MNEAFDPESLENPEDTIFLRDATEFKIEKCFENKKNARGLNFSISDLTSSIERRLQQAKEIIERPAVNQVQIHWE